MGVQQSTGTAWGSSRFGKRPEGSYRVEAKVRVPKEVDKEWGFQMALGFDKPGVLKGQGVSEGV